MSKLSFLVALLEFMVYNTILRHSSAAIKINIPAPHTLSNINLKKNKVPWYYISIIIAIRLPK